MKKLFISLLSFTVLTAGAQKGYDIKINFKGCPDSTVYLARYFWEQLPVADSCKKIRNGRISFKGDYQLPKGVYFLANQERNNFYLQFLVDDNQNFTINLDNGDILNTQKSDDRQNEQFFAYVKFMTQKNRELSEFSQKMKGKPDSAKQVNERARTLQEQTTKYDADFQARNKGTMVSALMKLKNEKYATEIPKAANGRPDSTYQYRYYKAHYFDDTDFKDDRLLYTPFFADKVKKYFDQLVVQHPDSMIKELDMILSRCVPGSEMFNTLVGHYTHKAEQNKTMSFDQSGKMNTYEKVFIHLADKYIVSGKTDGYYPAETVAKIRERIEILKNLQPGVKVPDLYMIDTTYGRQVLRLGFDTARSSESVTKLYNRHSEKLAPMYRTLYGLNNKYTVLVFWAADCGHCQTEIPKLHKELQKLKGQADIGVFAVQTKEELFETWKKFVNEKKLDGFTHVFDPIHINALTLKERFDIVATPVIYLLDKDKRIIAKKLGSEQVTELITMLDKLQVNIKN